MVTPDAVVSHANGASSSTRVDKMVLVMAGKLTYSDKHFSPPSKALVAVMLLGGVLVRSTVSRLIRRDTVWVGVWRRRPEWRTGFPVRPRVERLDGTG